MNTGKATLIKSTGSWYEILTDDGSTLRCRIRGRLRLRGTRTTNPVAVGDRVSFETDRNGENVITDVEPRRNYILRKASNLSKESHIIAANIDAAAIVVTLHSPVTSTEFIDRLLVTCEAYNVPPIIVLNKIDLARNTPQQLEEFLYTYSKTGYRIIRLSALSGEGMGELSETTEGRTTLLTGNSGVGKSTIIKALVPEAQIKTGDISHSHHKGMHTTTFACMYDTAGGGRIIDTPGIKGFGLMDIDNDELARYFPDFMRFAPSCGYYNCTHTHEPSCAVIEAVQRGEIPVSRYQSYLKMLDEDDKYR